jgi:hypothetical protein
MRVNWKKWEVGRFKRLEDIGGGKAREMGLCRREEEDGGRKE